MADDQDIEGSDLSALIAGEIRSAKRFADTELSDKRAQNIEYYNGTMSDLPAPPNRSSVMSRDVTDTISWVLPGIIRVFTASDNMALYEPTTEKDRDGAQQATDYINYLFFKENDGYRNLYNATHDSALGGNGIVYHYWDPTPQTEISFHTRLTPDGLAVLVNDEGVEVLAHEQNDEPDTMQVPGPDGQMVEMPVPTFNVKVQRTTARGKLCIHTCKPENFYLDSEATTIEEARFCAYLHEHKTRSDLIEMGFDREVVDDLPADTLSLSDEESLARVRDTIGLRTQALKSQELIDLYECYVKADVDGDGIAELLQVWYAGNAGAGKVLDWSEWEDELPFSDIPCYPVPHRWDADSVADRVKDIQKVKTVLLRQGLDNIYDANLPMLEAEAGTVLNPDILVHKKFGGIVWRKTGSIATAPIKPLANQFIADKAFTAMNYMDEVIAKRTGISRTTMALDPEALQNQTATASQNQRDAGYSQIELIARNQALGWTRVFRALLRLVVKHQDRPKVIRLRDKFVEMDPRSWNADMDVTINTGLGTGSRDRDLAMLQTVKQDQFVLATQFAERGAVDKAIDMIPRILLTMKQSAESAGLKNPDAFYPEFGEAEVGQMKQDAAKAAEQPPMEIQIEQAKIEATKETEAAKAQANAVKEAAQMEADLATAEKGQAFEREKFDKEMLFRYAELAQKRDIELMKIGAQRQAARAKAKADGEDGEESEANGSSEIEMPGIDASAAILARLSDMMMQMHRSMNAPTEIVRDEQGRAIGTRKVAVN